MSNTAALINRHSDDPIAWLSKPLVQLNSKAGVISAQQFLNHVYFLAEQLPQSHSQKPHCINLCHNRYLFMVTFCAVIVRQQTNLLPSNKTTATQARLHERYSEAYIVHDGLPDLADNVAAINLQELTLFSKEVSSICSDHEALQIDLEHIAAISFTSGSTGDAKAIIKTWHTFVASTAINASYMLPNEADIFYHVATVPSQHMWGLETTVLMALLSNVCLVDEQPFFPPDIYALLDKLPGPKGLVTTPLHLRAINASSSLNSQLDNILVATAPLNTELAQAVEQKLQTQIREIYGCSEVGSMSIRRPTQTDQWRRFDGLDFTAQDNGRTTVSAKHLPDSVLLDDQITMIDHQYFILTGRNSDQINIAGKRGSLLEVNNVLMKFPNLIDGVVIFPPQKRSIPRLVALVVLPQITSKEDLRDHFSQYLDSAFVPRPIVLVDALPREENGKLIKAKLLELYSL